MDNRAGTKELEYTLYGDKHEGYTIEFATSPSQSEPGKWLGHYGAFKVGEKTLRASTGSTYDGLGEAQNAAIRCAKAAIDEAIAAKR